MSRARDNANLSPTIPDARMPNLTGDITTSEGAVATSITADAVGTDELANDVVISTSGAITTSNAVNSSISGSFYMHGANGTAGNPNYCSYGFNGDDNTGMYRSGIDTLNFATEGASRMEIAPAASSGDVTVSTGNLVIGTSGKGIDFSATSDGGVSTPSELLDDYEEGTFTPIINASGDYSPSGYAATQTGKYTKIGNMVHCQGWMTITDKGTQTGFLRLDGLPFTVDGNESGASFSYLVGWNLSSGQQLQLWAYTSNMGYFMSGGTGNTDSWQISTGQLDTASTTGFSLTYTTNQ